MKYEAQGKSYYDNDMKKYYLKSLGIGVLNKEK